jgi:hypothetical protein
VVGHALVMEDERGRKKGCRGDRAPFIGDAAGVGDGLHAVPHGDKAWGGGLGASTASGWCGMAGSGATATLVGGARLAPKQGRVGAV